LQAIASNQALWSEQSPAIHFEQAVASKQSQASILKQSISSNQFAAVNLKINQSQESNLEPAVASNQSAATNCQQRSRHLQQGRIGTWKLEESWTQTASLPLPKTTDSKVGLVLRKVDMLAELVETLSVCGWVTKVFGAM
jgi:hypothetical protein